MAFFDFLKSAKIDFTKNQSARNILKFPHCTYIPIRMHSFTKKLQSCRRYLIYLSNTIISVLLIQTRKFNFTKNVNFQQIIIFVIDMITTQIIIFSIPFKSHLVKNFSSKFYYKRNSCI